MRNPNEWQDQESCVVRRPMKMPLALFRGPTDERIARGALPGRRSKHHASQEPLRFIGDRISEILANRSAPTQIMKLPQSCRALVPRPVFSADLTDRQSPYARKRSRYRSRIPFASSDRLAAHHPIRRRLAPRRQLEVATLVEFHQQTPRGHILQPTTSIPPTPFGCQRFG